MEFRLPALFIVILLLLGCETTYYKTMEKLGYHKRDLMVERVEEATGDCQDHHR